MYVLPLRIEVGPAKLFNYFFSKQDTTSETQGRKCCVFHVYAKPINLRMHTINK